MSDPTKRRQFYAALKTKTGLEVGEDDASGQQVRALFRMPEGQMRQWLVVMHQILLAELSAPWSVDISKKYFLKGGKTVQGWRVIVKATDIDAAMTQLTTIVNRSPKARFQLDEVTLVGRKEDTGLNERGKGATLIGGDFGVPPIARMIR